MSSISFTIPLPPSTNSLYYNLKSGGRRKTKAYKDWIKSAGWEVKIQANGWRCTGPWSMELQAVHPDTNRKRDLDNLLKAACDLFVSLGLVSDDSDMLSVTARWIPAGPEVPMCKITIITH